MSELLDFIFHIQKHLDVFVQNYGVWVYALLFAIIFCETGLVVTPFLPGDSLLLVVGAMAAAGTLKTEIVLPILLVAAILGHTVNYSIGKWIGPRVFHFESNRFFNRDHLLKAHAFYEKYGGRAVILSRFVPVIRTFAPFVAGVGTMHYARFTAYNVIGAVLWIGFFFGGGLFFGNIPVVKQNMHFVVLAVIVISMLPIAWEIGNAWYQKKSAKK